MPFIPDNTSGFIPDIQPQPSRLRRFGGAAIDFLLKQPVKFAISAAEVPETLINVARGKAIATPQRTYNIPGISPFKSFQSEAETRFNKIQSGEKPLFTALAPFAEVPLAGAEILGLKGLAQTAPRLFSLAKGFVSKTSKRVFAKSEEKLLQNTLKATEPTLSKAEKITTLKTVGRPGGATVEGRIFPEITRTPGGRDIEVAKEAMRIGIKDPSKPVQNLQKINSEIARISEQEVRPFLRANPRIYNNNTLVSKLTKIDPPDLVKADTSLEKAYGLVRSRVIKTIQKSKHTMEGLWDARKTLDKTMEKEFGEALWNIENSLHVPVKRAYLDMRRVIKDFIIENIGEKGKIYGELLNRETLLFEAQQNIAEQSYKLLGKSGFKAFLQRHPLFKEGLKYIGAGTVGAGAFGLGIKTFGE